MAALHKPPRLTGCRAVHLAALHKACWVHWLGTTVLNSLRTGSIQLQRGISPEEYSCSAAT